MMLEPRWQDVAEVICEWLVRKNLYARDRRPIRHALGRAAVDDQVFVAGGFPRE